MMEEGLERVKATYRGNFDRLATVKAKYDPSNLFRVNQNIQPELGMGGTMNKKDNNLPANETKENLK